VRTTTSLSGCLLLFFLAAPLEAQAGRITPALMMQHIGALADDSMRGRGTPSPELDKAAQYVEAVFRHAGLVAAGDSGGFIQRFPVRGGTAPNVIGVMRGHDRRLAGEYVVVVAHLDHLGTASSSNGCRASGADSICNGADDNASGSAGLLALVSALSGSPPRPRRSILFLSVTGEERGLLGSRWYVGHPTVPLDSIVGLVNLDMIGRNSPDSIFLNGWGKSTLSSLVQKLAAQHHELGLSVGPDIEDRPTTPGDSDHFPFQRRGVPYIFFYSGEHHDYHRVTDEPSRIDADKASRVARLAFFTVQSVANDSASPAWDPESRRLNVADRP
jgi:Zn-dependent M28 family amino/carboxypeptidase